VSQAIQEWLNDESRVLQAAQGCDARQARNRIVKARELAANIRSSQRQHLAGSIQRVTVGLDRVQIALSPAGLGPPEVQDRPDEEPIVIDVPVKLRRSGMAVRLIVNVAGVDVRQAPDTTLVALLAKAHDWFGRLTSGQIEGVGALAMEEGVSVGYATRMIHLALMAPDIVQRIVRGEQPAQLTAAWLMQQMPLPPDWAEQRRMLEFSE
jgi:site-specific DNA recombinase